jgi:N-acyl-D-amino-acid deacylase
MFDRYPYVAYSTELPMFIPQWALQGSREEKVERLKDKVAAIKIDEYALTKIKDQGGGQNILITSCKSESNRVYIGKNMEECADISGKNMPTFIRDLLVQEKMDVDIIGFTMSEKNLRMILSHPLSMPVTDGSIYSQKGPLSLIMPHPRCYNTFPRFIGKYGRDEKLLSLSDAIKKMSSTPASRIGLKHRGQIQIGYYADIVIFNPNTIIDQSDYTNPHQYPLGIDHVLVNGEWTIKDGQHTGAMDGMMLRKGA